MEDTNPNVILGIKDYNMPDYEKIKQGQLDTKIKQQDVQSNEMKLNTMRQTQQDASAINKSLSDIDMKDPDYINKASEQMKANGISPMTILAWKNSQLTAQQATTAKEYEIAKAKTEAEQHAANLKDENIERVQKQMDRVIASQSDVVSIYDNSIKNGANSQQATANARAAYQQHLAEAMGDPNISDETKKQLDSKSKTILNSPNFIEDVKTQLGSSKAVQSGINSGIAKKLISNVDKVDLTDPTAVRKYSNQLRSTGDDQAMKIADKLDADAEHIGTEANQKAQRTQEQQRIGIEAKNSNINQERENIDAHREQRETEKDQGGAGGGRESVMNQRVINASNGATVAIKNIAELPLTSSSGFFNGYTPDKTGLSGITKGVLANKVTSDDAQRYNSMMAGVSRQLGTLETSGLAVPGSLTHSIDALQIKEGDSVETKMTKMAELRQIVEANNDSMQTNPHLTKDQKALLQKNADEVAKAIPFTNHDITMLSKSKNGTTLGDAMNTQKKPNEKTDDEKEYEATYLSK
jgi:hypothetical protein